MRRAGLNGPKLAAAAILIAGWIVPLVLSWPGHLSYDSIVQLHDGRTGYYHSWHPPVMAWLLGLGDAIIPGAGLFVVFDTLLFFGALLSLLWIGPRVSKATIVVALVLIVLPQVVLYQMIVWKDVLFANCAVAGFICLAQAEVRWANSRARIVWIVLGFAALVLATLTRQNGAIALVGGVFALGVIALRAVGLKAMLAYGGVALAVGAIAVIAISFALAMRSDNGEGPRAQLKLLRLYDLIGAVAAQPSLPLDRLAGDDPELETRIRTDGVRLYTPERNDTLVSSPALRAALADAKPAWLSAQWNDLVLHHPWLYLKVRAAAFGWVFFTPDIAACRPVFVGIEGPAGAMGDLGLAPRKDARDMSVSAYAKSFMGTPVFSHPTYAVLAFAAFFLLLLRRSPGDTAIAFMLLAAFAFSASFFAISIACDYRYLYFLDLSAMSAVFYLALNPRYLFQVVATWSGSFWLFLSDAKKS